MRTVFGNWKYIFKNLWCLLPFAVAPAVFLAFSLDYARIAALVRGFFTGAPQSDFLQFFHAWSLIRFDSALGACFSAAAVVSIAVCMALVAAFVEKHMRLGKRTPSGLWTQFKNVLPSAIVITLGYVLLYEIFAVVLSAILYVISQAEAAALVYVLYCCAIALFFLVLVYLATFSYLWLPCKQMTGFGAFEAFLYSYRLVVEQRKKLVLSFLVSLAAVLAVLWCSAEFLPEYAFRIVGGVLFLFLFLSFCVRMQVVYFEADKLEREDEKHGYRR